MVKPKPTFNDLTRAESDALLVRNHVGRIAFTFHDRVGLEPIGYVYEANRIYMRTAPGSKLATIAHHPWVAFEVDEVKGAFDWHSVVVHGTAMVLHPEGDATDRNNYEHALAVLRRAVPGTLEDSDPTPFRTVIVVIYIDEITGRSASTHTPSHT
jgi:nitroimidazol reductase NimA-like FMN-containing flavoprotein (pyridoxamine 5'-phosphate oxidase superfamily)